jgi:hypothetical protein
MGPQRLQCWPGTVNVQYMRDSALSGDETTLRRPEQRQLEPADGLLRHLDQLRLGA